MSKILIDTDVLIESLRGNHKIVDYLVGLHEKGSAFFYSPITKAEIYHGIRSGEEKKVESLFESMQCIPITAEIGEKGGLYLKQFHASHRLQLGDALISATANIVDASLLTCNYRHYPMKDIKVIVPE